MQPTSSEKPTELQMWWPDPFAFEDLTVDDAENGFDLSAPDGTACAEWLEYWNQDEEHHKFFQEEFIKILVEYAKLTLETHGQSQDQSDEQSADRAQTENDCSGVLEAHQSGSDA